MGGIDIVVQIENPIQFRLKIVDLYVFIGQQRLYQRRLLREMILKTFLLIECVPFCQRIGREEEREFGIRMRLLFRNLL